YLRTDDNLAGVGGPPWFSEFGFQQTRGFRALKVWMAMRHLGVDGYRRTIDREIALAGELASRLRARGGFEGCEPHGPSTACFRSVADDPGGDVERLNAMNKAVLEEVQLGGRAFLSSTVIDGVFWLRACIVNPRTTSADVEALVDAVATAAASRA